MLKVESDTSPPKSPLYTNISPEDAVRLKLNLEDMNLRELACELCDRKYGWAGQWVLKDQDYLKNMLVNSIMELDDRERGIRKAEEDRQKETMPEGLSKMEEIKWKRDNMKKKLMAEAVEAKMQAVRAEAEAAERASAEAKQGSEEMKTQRLRKPPSLEPLQRQGEMKTQGLRKPPSLDLLMEPQKLEVRGAEGELVETDKPGVKGESRKLSKSLSKISSEESVQTGGPSASEREPMRKLLARTDAELQGIQESEKDVSAGGGKRRNKTKNRQGSNNKKKRKTKNRQRSNNKGKRKTKNKFSLKNAKKRMISKEKYKELIQKRQHNKKLSLNDRKKLDHALFINYCKCVKSLKYDSKVKDYLEYPVCMSSIYKKRGFNPPKGVTVRCKKYK